MADESGGLFSDISHVVDPRGGATLEEQAVYNLGINAKPSTVPEQKGLAAAQAPLCLRRDETEPDGLFSAYDAEAIAVERLGGRMTSWIDALVPEGDPHERSRMQGRIARNLVQFVSSRTTENGRLRRITQKEMDEIIGQFTATHCASAFQDMANNYALDAKTRPSENPGYYEKLRDQYQNWANTLRSLDQQANEGQ